MSTFTNTGLVGLEQIQRATFVQIFTKLNDYIAQIESFMKVSDEEIASLTGVTYPTTDLERVANDNFYEGHRPSLINAPIDRYPNVAVMAVRGIPSEEDPLFDQLDSYRDMIVVELMVKALDSEETVNRRAHRMAEAVNMSVMSDKSLGGTVSGFDSGPIMNLSDVFTRKERSAYGAEWFWQGARIEYAVRKEAVIPPSSTGSIFRSAPETVSRPEFSQFIDQG